MMMDVELSKQLQNFRDNVTKEAEVVVFKTFPEKILHLQAILDSSSDSSSPYNFRHAQDPLFTDAKVYPAPASDSGSDRKKRKRDNDSADESLNLANGTTHPRYPNLVHANKHLLPIHEQSKRECEELITLCDKVKLWVNLTMPKIEDGDNFGVQIQEEVLTELHRAQESGYNLRDSCRSHHLSRAKICSKIIKYPNIEDYTMSLKEHDEKQLYMARQSITDLRNIYAVLTDIVHKNIAKIRSPKGNNSGHMY